MKIQIIISVIVIATLTCQNALASDKELSIYIDADYTNNLASANMIQLGIETAFSEVNFTVQGYKIKVVPKDHRSNVALSKNNIESFLKDESALLIFGGKHSAPIIKNLEYINVNKILTLVPWAAGAPITRFPSEENWIFRLSIDDASAASKMAKYASESLSCNNVHLILEDTPWGNSNYKYLSRAFQKEDILISGVSKFGLGVKSAHANKIARTLKSEKADCALMVSGSAGSKFVISALYQEYKKEPNEKIKIISHWGITGADFTDDIGYEMRESLNLRFIQTCFSFNKNNLRNEPKVKAVLKQAQKISEKTIGSRSISPPAGFAHGYDLTQLLLAALEKVTLNQDMESNRQQIKDQLENLDREVQGLVKNYKKPFSKYSESDFYAHEALEQEDYCMGKFNEQNLIILVE